MKGSIIVLLLCCGIVFSCSSLSNGPGDAQEVADIRTVRDSGEITVDNAGKIVKKYGMNFDIPNPFHSDSGGRSGKRDLSHEPTILCRAVLLDDYSTEADILFQCKADSLDESQCKAFREEYIEKNMRNGMFRIRIEMESGFSDKSMNPEHWSMYIENADGVMIEPVDITVSGVDAVKDSVFSDYYNVFFKRNLLRRNITLYFKTRTFFGQDIFGGDNPFIVFVMSREKKVLARLAWKISEKAKSD